MNIFFCKNNFAGPISGADEIALTYAIELRAAGHTTSILLVQPPAKNDPLAARLRAADVPLDTLASPAFSTSLATARRFAIRAMRTFSPVSGFILSNSRKVVFNLLQQYHVACCEYLKRKRPDVVHVLTPDHGAFMLVRAAHESKIPVVYQEVGIPFHPPGFEDVYERFVSVLPLCAEVTALSPSLAEQLGRVSTRSSPAKVLPLISPDHNGFPKSHSTSEVVTFGFAARLEHLKGPLRLLEAFSVAQQTHREMKLCIAGEGSQRREFVAASRRLGLEEKCELVGVYKSTEERSNFMKRIDVFVLPSLTEGTPNVIIEAMAHEKPIIATAVGGVPDLVPEDVGILVPPDDTHALAAAMTRMAVDVELRRRMGAAARRKYEQLFTPAAVLPVLLDLYAGMIEKTRPNGHVNANRPMPSHPWVNNGSTNHSASSAPLR
jgi:glycosyltransferase involved in cell wall biosynthesis